VKRERRRDIIYNGTEGREFRLAVRLWEGLLTDMETALAAHGGDWIMGDDYTLVDLAYTPYLTRLDHLNALGFIADRPRLQAWYARVRARPSYDTAIGAWDNADYVALMREKGGEAWPRVKRIVAEL
jgi:glutathione S-transferase